jgi:hypothetical protein
MFALRLPEVKAITTRFPGAREDIRAEVMLPLPTRSISTHSARVPEQVEPRVEVASNKARSERVWAAVSHLGVPFWSLILPTVVWSVSPVGSFRRLHARQAFSYQLVYLPFHLFFTALMLWGPVGPLLICMLVGFILELPQIARAMMGKKPYPLPPFQLLKP